MSKEVTVIPPEKEIKEYKSQVDLVVKGSNELSISSQEDMERGTDLLASVKEVKKSITERKEAITRPLMEALASARDLFKPLESGYAEAEKTIKAKMLEFSIAENERIEKEKSRVEARVEKGTMRVDTAIKKIEDIGDKKSSFEGSTGKVSIRIMRKVRIVDENLIPREYLVPDTRRITQVALVGVVIPGVEIFEDKVIASGTR
jgi:hypothetical protein